MALNDPIPWWAIVLIILLCLAIIALIIILIYVIIRGYCKHSYNSTSNRVYPTIVSASTASVNYRPPLVKISSATQTRGIRAGANVHQSERSVDRTQPSSRQHAQMSRHPQPSRSNHEPIKSTAQLGGPTSSVSAPGRSKVVAGVVTPSAVSVAASSMQGPPRRPKVLLEENEDGNNEGAADAANEVSRSANASNNSRISIFDQLPDVEETSKNTGPGANPKRMKYKRP